MTSAPAARLKLDRPGHDRGREDRGPRPVRSRHGHGSVDVPGAVRPRDRRQRRLGERRARLGRRQADRRRARSDARRATGKTAGALPSSEQRGARMNVDRYTKAVLTVIAGCLLWICAMGAGPSLDAQSVAVRRIPHSSIQPVVIVGTGHTGSGRHRHRQLRAQPGRPAHGSDPADPAAVHAGEAAARQPALHRGQSHALGGAEPRRCAGADGDHGREEAGRLGSAARARRGRPGEAQTWRRRTCA